VLLYRGTTRFIGSYMQEDFHLKLRCGA
jgi:hypothetical protein